MKIIALIGPAGSGKSTAAAHLVERYGAKKYAFAAPLKEIAMRTLGFTREQVWGTQTEKEAVDPRYGFSPRWFLQRLGTEGCRAVLGENVWIDALLAQVRREAPDVAVIEDARFANEAWAVQGAGAEVWRLEPPGGVRACADPGTHASEQEWQTAPYDRIICPAEYGVEHLRRAVDEAWADMNGWARRHVTHEGARRKPEGRR